MSESKQRRGDFPYDLPEWAAANPVLLCHIAGCMAASTTAQITGATPGLFHTAMQSAAASYSGPERTATAPATTALFFVPPQPAPALPPRRLIAQEEPAPVSTVCSASSRICSACHTSWPSCRTSWAVRSPGSACETALT